MQSAFDTFTIGWDVSEIYKCDNCGGVFDKERSDEEAWEEARKEFGEMANAPHSTVCDDCYREFMKWYRANQKSN